MRPLFRKVLVANRGEIALRIIRACKELGISTVAIHSEEDATALYVKKADEACLVGPGPVAGYLNIYRIVDLARQLGVEAIHPGYGFLAENPEFARACQRHGLVFIGPPPEVIARMGDKVAARTAMIQAGVPVVPGMDHPLSSVQEALSVAREMGYPVMLKASGGGGGRGLRVCQTPQDLERLYPVARSEAERAFGCGDLYLEKYIRRPRHIEVQILADTHGQVIHLGERDCSIQRRHQKLVEVAPSPFVDDDLRRRLGEAAVRAARAVGYVNAGTIEFLVDEHRNFYFLEMNTRIQVEHPVTEEVTGVDIVKEMIRVAAGLPLSITQQEVELRGYAMEFRINAEDPAQEFLPNFGKITAYYSPGGPGIRIDGNIYRGSVVPPHYDSLLCKMTVWGRDWEECLQRSQRALEEFLIRGVRTTIPLFQRIVADPDFRRGDFHTQFLESRLERLLAPPPRDRMDEVMAIAAAIAAHGFR